MVAVYMRDHSKKRGILIWHRDMFVKCQTMMKSAGYTPTVEEMRHAFSGITHEMPEEIDNFQGSCINYLEAIGENHFEPRLSVAPLKNVVLEAKRLLPPPACCCSSLCARLCQAHTCGARACGQRSL